MSAAATMRLRLEVWLERGIARVAGSVCYWHGNMSAAATMRLRLEVWLERGIARVAGSVCYWHGNRRCRCRAVDSVQALREAVDSGTLMACWSVLQQACDELGIDYGTEQRAGVLEGMLLDGLEGVAETCSSDMDEMIASVFDDYRYYPMGVM